MVTAMPDRRMELTWESEGDSPFAGDLSDMPKVIADNITHVRLGFDEFEWVEYKGRDSRGYKLLHSPSSKNTTETCPEDIWGVRLRRVRVETQE